MKYECELIQDLLPLYEEALCSDATRRAVEEHLRCCENCRRLTAPLPIEEPEDTPNADRAVKKGIKSVRRRWLSSLIAAVLVIIANYFISKLLVFRRKKNDTESGK